MVVASTTVGGARAPTGFRPRRRCDSRYRRIARARDRGNRPTRLPRASAPPRRSKPPRVTHRFAGLSEHGLASRKRHVRSHASRRTTPGRFLRFHDGAESAFGFSAARRLNNNLFGVFVRVREYIASGGKSSAVTVPTLIVTGRTTVPYESIATLLKKPVL